MSRWRTLDLFCGAAGGWTLGLHRAGFQTVAACEIDPWRSAVFRHNNPGVTLYDDVRTLGADRLFGDLGFLPEIVCGSPPCQDASTANTNGRGVDGERTGLFFEAVRIVREVRPRWVLLENVPGLRTRGYDRVHDALAEAGYAVWPLVVGAVHTGAPHLRKRVWIVALAKSAQEQMGRTGFARAEAERISTDADRDGIRKQSRRGDGADGQAPTITQIGAVDAALMYGLEIAGRQPDGNRTEAVGRQDDRPVASEQIAPDTDEAGLEERGGTEPDAPQHPAAIDILGAFRDWNGGPPSIGGVDDGLSAALAYRRGLGRACLAAYGDAVVPQITEAIGRAIMTVDTDMQCRAAGHLCRLGDERAAA